MPDEQPDSPGAPPGPPPYPGSPPPPYPGSPPPYPGGPAPSYPGSPPPGSPDAWYRPPPPPGSPGGYYYPPGSPPPGQWGGSPGYGAPQGYPGASPYASYWARVGGFLIDAVIVGVISLIYDIPAHAFRNQTTIDNGTSTVHFNFNAGGILVPLLISVLYAGFLIGGRGQTLGMMAARIRAVDGSTGQLIGFWRAVGRDLFERLLGFLLAIPLLIDLLFPAWDPRRQTLHDKVTNTVVVRV